MRLTYSSCACLEAQLLTTTIKSLNHHLSLLIAACRAVQVILQAKFSHSVADSAQVSSPLSKVDTQVGLWTG
jgi:hypothetical protein